MACNANGSKKKIETKNHNKIGSNAFYMHSIWCHVETKKLLIQLNFRKLSCQYIHL